MSLVVGAVSLAGRHVVAGAALALVLVATDAGGLGLAVVVVHHAARQLGRQLGVQDVVQPGTLVGQREVGCDRERCERGQGRRGGGS